MQVDLAFHWKCLRKREDDSGPAESGATQTFATVASGYAGRSFGSL
jgi:hypothetical protein